MDEDMEGEPSLLRIESVWSEQSGEAFHWSDEPEPGMSPAMVQGNGHCNHDERMRERHSDKVCCGICEKLVCYECLKTVASTLKVHFEEKTKGNGHSYNCPKCPLLFSSLCSFKAHIRLHLLKPPYLCPDCGFLADTVGHMVVHFQESCFHIYKKLMYTCLYCSLSMRGTIDSNQRHKDHMQQHMKYTVVGCTVCKLVFDSKEEWQHHTSYQCSLLNVGKGVECFVCEICADLTLLRAEYEKHLELHLQTSVTTTVIYACPCSTHFDSALDLSWHLNECSRGKDIPKEWAILEMMMCSLCRKPIREIVPSAPDICFSCFDSTSLSRVQPLTYKSSSVPITTSAVSPSYSSITYLNLNPSKSPPIIDTVNNESNSTSSEASPSIINAVNLNSNSNETKSRESPPRITCESVPCKPRIRSPTSVSNMKISKIFCVTKRSNLSKILSQHSLMRPHKNIRHAYRVVPPSATPTEITSVNNRVSPPRVVITPRYLPKPKLNSPIQEAKSPVTYELLHKVASPRSDSPPLLEATAKPLLEATAKPLLEATAKPLLEATAKPLLEATAKPELNNLPLSHFNEHDITVLQTNTETVPSIPEATFEDAMFNISYEQLPIDHAHYCKMSEFMNMTVDVARGYDITIDKTRTRTRSVLELNEITGLMTLKPAKTESPALPTVVMASSSEDSCDREPKAAPAQKTPPKPTGLTCPVCQFKLKTSPRTLCELTTHFMIFHSEVGLDITAKTEVVQTPKSKQLYECVEFRKTGEGGVSSDDDNLDLMTRWKTRSKKSAREKDISKEKTSSKYTSSRETTLISKEGGHDNSSVVSVESRGSKISSIEEGRTAEIRGSILSKDQSCCPPPKKYSLLKCLADRKRDKKERIENWEKEVTDSTADKMPVNRNTVLEQGHKSRFVLKKRLGDLHIGAGGSSDHTTAPINSEVRFQTDPVAATNIEVRFQTDAVAATNSEVRFQTDAVAATNSEVRFQTDAVAATNSEVRFQTDAVAATNSEGIISSVNNQELNETGAKTHILCDADNPNDTTIEGENGKTGSPKTKLRKGKQTPTRTTTNTTTISTVAEVKAEKTEVSVSPENDQQNQSETENVSTSRKLRSREPGPKTEGTVAQKEREFWSEHDTTLQRAENRRLKRKKSFLVDEEEALPINNVPLRRVVKKPKRLIETIESDQMSDSKADYAVLTAKTSTGNSLNDPPLVIETSCDENKEVRLKEEKCSDDVYEDSNKDKKNHEEGNKDRNSSEGRNRSEDVRLSIKMTLSNRQWMIQNGALRAHTQDSNKDSDIDEEMQFLEKSFGQDEGSPCKRKRKLSSKLLFNKIVDGEEFPSGQYVPSKCTTTDKIWCCTCCKAIYVDKEAFQNHVAVHRVDESSLQCLECGDCFVVLPSLQKHLRAYHGIKDPTQYLTQHGGYGNIKEEQVASEADVGNYESENDFEPKENQCTVCRDQFNNSTDLKKHFRVHGMAFLKQSQRLQNP